MASDRAVAARTGLRRAGTTFISMVLYSLTAGSISADSPERQAADQRAKAAILGVPLSFEFNDGQTDSQVKFLSHGDGYSLFLTSNEAVFTLRTPAGIDAPPSVFRMELAGASRDTRVYGTEKLPGPANYFVGSDRKKWRSGIGEYGKVNYGGVYPGIDAVFYGNQRQLEYDFAVAPGADPGQISLAITGATPSLDGGGNVSLKLADGDLTLKKPVVYQDIDGRRKIVDAGYTIAGNRVRFHLGKYDHSRVLVIDPVFTYLTYLGGSGPDQIGVNQINGQTSSPNQALAIDTAGNVYVTGYTLSTDFPLTRAYQSAHKGTNWNAFVSALNPSGTALLYSTYLGGTVYTAGSSIVWDSHDNAVYVGGSTNSPDFPITAGAFQSILAPSVLGTQEYSTGQYNAFVAKFSATGQLTNSTFLGGDQPTGGFGVATDGQGRAYVVGTTQYDCTSGPSYKCFPTTPGAVIPAGTISQNGNGFVSVFDPNLSTLLYSTLLGDVNGAPSSSSEAFGVTVDPSGNFYVVGVTSSASLPTTPGAYQPKLGPPASQPLVGFAAKFGPVSASGAAVTYITYLEATGTGFGDFAGGVAADNQGNAYVGGYTNSPSFPVTAGAYSTPCPLNGARLCPAAFVTKLNPAGTGVVWSALVEPADFFSAIQLDAQGNVYVVGHSSGPFTAVNSVEPGLISGGFVSELDPSGSSLLFSSVVGASPAVTSTGNSSLAGVAVDSQGNVYVTGSMNDATLPTTPGVVQPKFAGGQGAQGDGLIAKINLAPAVLSGGVVPVYSSSTTIQPGEWASIYGSGLASATTVWAGDYPVSLGGTSVTINGKLAYLSLVSPTQINFQAPDDTATGSVPVVVKTPNGSVTSTVTLAQLAPSLFLLGDAKHVAGIILRSNGTGAYGGGTYDIIGPMGSSLGYATVAAKAGDTVSLYGTGFGPTDPPVTPGQSFAGAAKTTNPVTISINGVSVTPSFAGLSGAGVDQMNLTIPAGLGAGDFAVSAKVGCASTQANVVISLQ